MTRFLSIKILAALVMVLILCGFIKPALCDVPDFDSYSFEDLATIGLSNAPKGVTASTAAKISQTMENAPAVVRIITAEDIRVYGYRSFDDILRSLPGLYTTNDEVNTYLGVRGLGRPGDYNTRVLILINGVRVNDNIYDSALVGMEFPLDPQLIDRIEYAPGPGSAVYGNNAFLGVINVITKRGHQYDGFKASAGVGSFNTRKLQLGYGNRFASGAEVLLSFTDFENADIRSGGAWAPDGADSDFDTNQTFLGKFSLGGFSAQIVYGNRENGLYAFTDSEMAGNYDTFYDKKFIIDARYAFNISDAWAFEMSAAYHKASLKGVSPYEDDWGRYTEVEQDTGRWLTGEFRAINSYFKNHRILIGIEGHKDLELESQLYEQGYFPDFYMSDQYTRYGIYIQDDMTLTDTLNLIAGARYDHAKLGSRVNPRAGLIWCPSEDTTAKFLYGSAFRTANFFEASVNLDASEYSEYKTYPVPELETIDTYEIAVEQYLTPSFRLSAALYYYRLSHIIEEQFLEDETFTFKNGDPISAKGIEIELEKRFSSGITIDLSYTVQRAEGDDGKRLSNSPAHQLKTRVSTPLWSDRARLGMEAQYTGSRTTEEGVSLDGFWMANATLSFPVNDFIEISASMYNIADTSYYDPARAIIGAPDGIRQEGRSAYFQMDFKF